MVSNMINSPKKCKTTFKNIRIKKSDLNIDCVSKKPNVFYNYIIEEEGEEEIEEIVIDSEDLREYNHLNSLSIEYLSFVSEMKKHSFNDFFMNNVTSDDVVKFVRSNY